MTAIARIAVLWFMAACASSSPPASSPGPAPAPDPAPAPEPAPPPAVDLSQLGSPCDGAGKTCAVPATCIAYYGIAGPRGPEFKSCEIQCADDPKSCPAGTTCITIADGPGAVCRPGDR